MSLCPSCGAESYSETKFCPNCGVPLKREPIAPAVRVLVVFANPIGTASLRLGTEDRVIKESLYHGKHQDRIVIDICHAANIHDVRHALLRSNYHIIQFSGHSDNSALLFEDQEGNIQPVGLDVFASFLAAHSPPLECVILNACSTLDEGKLLAYDVPFVVAMRAPIEDKLAVEFSRGFYDAIAASKDIEFAYGEGRRCVQLFSNSQSDLPVLVKHTILDKYQQQPLGMRTAEYERWYTQLTAGKLEIRIDPKGTNEVNVLLAILDKVLSEAGFDKDTIDRTAIIVWELVSNVARHVANSFAIIGIEINKSYLPMTVVSVADQGSGFDLHGMVEQQHIRMKIGEPEHGLGRVLRLSDDLEQSIPSESRPFHTIFCTLYSIQPPNSVFDGFPWCARILLVYESPYCVWFGNSRHRLYGGNWGTITTLDFAIRNNIPQLLGAYLDNLITPELRYICFEEKGSRHPTEGPPYSRVTLVKVIGRYFQSFLEQERVLVFDSQPSVILRDFRDQFGDKHKIRAFSHKEHDKCLQLLRDIDRKWRKEQTKM